MALTKISRSLLDTGISDSSDATAITIDSSENVTIGVTNPVQISTNLMHGTSGQNGFYVRTAISSAANPTFSNIDDTNTGAFFPAADTVGFTTGGSERMRIDSSGNLLYDCTNVSQQTDDGIKFVSNGRIFTVSGYDSSAQENFSMYSTGASAFRFYVDWGGTIHATSTSISAISDQRLKENIVNLETGLTEVMALKPRRFDWKNGDKINVAGFIAQEVETVLPDLIDGFKNDTIEDAKGVRMGDMIPTLVKAIQEQQTIIDDLKARITTLEGS